MLHPLAGAFRALYGVLALTAFTLLLVAATLLALVVPTLAGRRAVTHRLARAGLAVLGLRVTIDGTQRLPAGSCVVVANHSSYLDGVVMKAMLPPRFTFVIKREAASMPVAGYLLRRIGSEFVDRHSEQGRRRDALRVLRKAESGQALVFFPEGTFDGERGLKRFHVGAFAAADRGGMPVVPVVIHGARHAMPNRRILVRPGRIRVEVLAPIEPQAAAGGASELRMLARRAILSRLDEPDLAPDQTRGARESAAA